MLGYGALREDRTVVNLGSDPSDVYSHSSAELPSSPIHRTVVHTHSSEDLYSWMAKQDAVTSNLEGKNIYVHLQIVAQSLPFLFNVGCLESKINTLHTESSGEPGTLPKESVAPTEIPLYPIQDSVRLLDANQIFQPLLSGLGVMPQQLRFTTMSDSSKSYSRFVDFPKSYIPDAGNDVTTLDALGSNFCLVGNMETMRIDIVVSEHGKVEKKKGKNKAKRLYIDINTGKHKIITRGSVFTFFFSDESPAFVCEKIAVELEIDRMTDMAVNEMMKTKNVLYISRGQLKNHTSTVINFTIGKKQFTYYV